jgi:hypothetical protein
VARTGAGHGVLDRADPHRQKEHEKKLTILAATGHTGAIADLTLRVLDQPRRPRT